jgi:hypothetical protein
VDISRIKSDEKKKTIYNSFHLTSYYEDHLNEEKFKEHLKIKARYAIIFSDIK